MEFAKDKFQVTILLATKLCVYILAGCGLAPSASRVDGHFEQMDKQQVDRILATKPVAVAEYEQTDSVLVGHRLATNMRTKDRSFEREIIDAGVELLIASRPRKNPIPWINGKQDSDEQDLLSSYDIRTKHVKAERTPEVIWTRDYAPIMAINKHGKPVLLDFNYHRNRPFADMFARSLNLHFPEAERLSVPLYLEGGNFMINKRAECFVSEAVVEANKKPLSELKTPIYRSGIVVPDELAPDFAYDYVPGLLYIDEYGDKRVHTDDLYLERSQVKSLIRKYVGCRKVHIMKPMPHESTGHIDMFMKFLNDDIILLSRLDGDRVAEIRNDEQQRVAVEIKNFLDRVRFELLYTGYDVKTIPMPVPEVLTQYDKRGIVVRTYVNSLLIVNGEKKLALVPSYEKGYYPDAHLDDRFYSYADASHLKDDLFEVEKVYKDAGYKVRFFNADALIRDLGALHCATMQYPKIAY